MPELKPTIEGGSIILLGSFNPKIFQPEWFVRQGLLSEAEIAEANIKIIHPQVSEFETEHFQIQVIAQRFSAVSQKSTNPVPLRDLVRGTFLILEHTPVTAMGLNCMMHYPMESEERWHRVGDKLAPKEGWNEILPRRVGLASLSLLTEKDPATGAVFRVRIEPSVQVKYGVYIEVNEHHQAPEAEALKSLMEILDKRWEETQNYGHRIADHILAWAEKG
ncbi:MAG: hypothetical protein WCE53_09690 [Candidatus Acidiferrum sp.]